MNEKNGFELVRRQSSAVEKAALGAKQILSGMVADALAVAHAEDVETIFNRGIDYYRGNGVTMDYEEATKWFRVAAERGFARAQSVLGVCYDNGIGVPKDAVEAFKWCRKAADQGYAEAQANLGKCYEDGLGVQQDHVKAAIWFRKAAEQGFVEAQKMLGFAYLNGNGVPLNDFEAYYWFRLAQEFGCENLANALVVAGASFPSSEERERLYQEFRAQKSFKK